MLPSHYFNPYERLAPFYDWMAYVTLIPFGGEDAFRERVLDLLDLQPGMRVLELGCGTGAMTARLLKRGVDVTAVDLSTPMLKRAQKRSPHATFIQKDILQFETSHPFDRVLLAFVLHEMDAKTRSLALKTAKNALSPEGRIGVVDFAKPQHGLLKWGLKIYLKITEPPTAIELIENGLSQTLQTIPLNIVQIHPLAKGTAQIVLAA